MASAPCESIKGTPYAGAEGRASLRRGGRQGEAAEVPVSVRRVASRTASRRSPRTLRDATQGREGAEPARRSRPTRRGERARWRQPIKDAAGERSAPPPLRAKRAPTRAPKGGHPALGAPLGEAGCPTRREVGGGRVAVWCA